MRRAYFRSSLFNILFYGTTFLACIALLPALLLPRKAFLGIVQIWLYIVMFLERNILGLYYEIRGAENLPEDGSFIIAAKHQSAYETFKLRLLFKDPAIILKRELLRIPLWGWYLKKSDVIAIDRSNAKSAMESIKRGALHMKEQGRPIVIFPQGTRVRPEETAIDKPYKAGIHRIQDATDLPIVPLALNSGMYWPRSGWFKSSGTIVFEFLEPIAPGMTSKALNAYLEDKIESASLALMDEAHEHAMQRPTHYVRNLLITALITTLLFVCYSVYWFKSADQIAQSYVTFMSDMSLSDAPPTPPVIKGYPLKMHISAPYQNIVFSNGEIKMHDLEVSGWPFPMTLTHVQTGALEIYYQGWAQPLRFNTLNADMVYRNRILHVVKSSLDKGRLQLQINGTVNFNQKPFPRLDLMASLSGYSVLLRDLANAKVIEPQAVVFIGAGLRALADEAGHITIPVHQKSRSLYAGPLRLFEVPQR